MDFKTAKRYIPPKLRFKKWEIPLGMSEEKNLLAAEMLITRKTVQACLPAKVVYCLICFPDCFDLVPALAAYSEAYVGKPIQSWWFFSFYCFFFLGVFLSLCVSASSSVIGKEWAFPSLVFLTPSWPRQSTLVFYGLQQGGVRPDRLASVEQKAPCDVDK